MLCLRTTELPSDTAGHRGKPGLTTAREFSPAGQKDVRALRKDIERRKDSQYRYQGAGDRKAV